MSIGNQSGTSQSLLNTSAATSSSSDAHATNIKSTEVISILKRRPNTSAENVNVNENLRLALPLPIAAGGHSPSLHSQTYSDSSLQKYEDDEANEDDDDSDSDWEGFQASCTDI